MNLQLASGAEQAHHGFLRLYKEQDGRLRLPLAVGPEQVQENSPIPSQQRSCSVESLWAPAGAQVQQGCQSGCCCWSRSPRRCAGPQGAGPGQRLAAAAVQRCSAVLAQRSHTALAHPPANSTSVSPAHTDAARAIIWEPIAGPSVESQMRSTTGPAAGVSRLVL